MDYAVKRIVLSSEPGLGRREAVHDIARCELMHKIIKQLIKDSEIAKEKEQSKKSQALLIEAWKITVNVMEASVA